VKLSFDRDKILTTEFGVGRDQGTKRTFHLVPVDADVQTALREIAEATWNAMQGMDDSPATYEPSEKYASSEYVRLGLNDQLARPLRDLHEANNFRWIRRRWRILRAFSVISCG
jgi:hypothetical protein